MVPPPPVAGTVEPGLSTVTAHLDRVEGEVIVFPDEPQAAVPIAQTNSAAMPEKLRDWVMAGRVRMGRNGCGAAANSQCFQDAYQRRLGHMAISPMFGGTRYGPAWRRL